MAGGWPALWLPAGFIQWGTSGGDLEEEGDRSRSLWVGFQLTGHLLGHLSTQMFLPESCNCSLLQVIIAVRHCPVPGFPLPCHPFLYSLSIKFPLSYPNFLCRDPSWGSSSGGGWCRWEWNCRRERARARFVCFSSPYPQYPASRPSSKNSLLLDLQKRSRI